MPQRKTFDSDDDEHFEILTADKPQIQVKDDKDSSGESGGIATDTESDSAPEDIDFKVSRETLLSKVKQTIKQIEQEKHKKKLKRKKQDELFKEQKKKKLAELEKKRLPDAFLAELSKAKPEVSESTPDVSVDNVEKIDSDNIDDVKERLTSDSTPGEDEESEDFIQLQKSEVVRAVCIKEALRNSLKSSSDSAADFRHRALFGSKVKRESAKEMQRKRLKRKVNCSSVL